MGRTVFSNDASSPFERRAALHFKVQQIAVTNDEVDTISRPHTATCVVKEGYVTVEVCVYCASINDVLHEATVECSADFLQEARKLSQQEGRDCPALSIDNQPVDYSCFSM